MVKLLDTPWDVSVFPHPHMHNFLWNLRELEKRVERGYFEKQ